VITKPIDIDLLVAAILHQLESPPENTVIVAAPLVEEPYGSTLIIDWLQLEQRYGSRPSFLERILRTFLTSNADTPHRIRLACKTDDVAELHKLAHGLAGSASFLLAGNVVRHAKAILAVTDSTESTLAEHGGELANALEAMLQEISNRNLS
jgi:HPt (histidine-containing phosphotransfer) domain-containing protein